MRKFVKDGIKHYISGGRLHTIIDGNVRSYTFGTDDGLNQEDTIKRLIELGFKEIK